MSKLVDRHNDDRLDDRLDGRFNGRLGNRLRRRHSEWVIRGGCNPCFRFSRCGVHFRDRRFSLVVFPGWPSFSRFSGSLRRNAESRRLRCCNWCSIGSSYRSTLLNCSVVVVVVLRFSSVELFPRAKIVLARLMDVFNLDTVHAEMLLWLSGNAGLVYLSKTIVVEC
jgi:hypothetical protein